MGATQATASPVIARSLDELEAAARRDLAYTGYPAHPWVPARLHDDSNSRSGDPIVVTTGPYLVRFSAPPATSGTPEHKQVGAHGFDPERVPDMKASFFAAGEDIRGGVTVASFANVDIYPLVAKLLGLDTSHLKTGPIDGDLRSLKGILRDKAVAAGN